MADKTDLYGKFHDKCVANGHCTGLEAKLSACTRQGATINYLAKTSDACQQELMDYLDCMNDCVAFAKQMNPRTLALSRRHHHYVI